jgi:hypothetical protein
MRDILVVYWYPTYLDMRAAVEAHLRALDGARDRIVYHNAFLAPSAALRRTVFDGVVLHNTFLGVRWNVDFDVYRERFAWLADVDRPKVAIPQDEYDHCDVLDEWLSELGASAVLSNFPAEQRGALYPTGAGGADFHQALTGYIDDRSAARLADRLRPLDERGLDVVYRAAKLPYWFGSHGQLKHRLAGLVAPPAEQRGLRVDISTRWEDTILGPAWWDFLLSGRSVIGCESGSSVRDRRGEVRRRVEEILREQPDASFEDVAAEMPAGWDSWTFFAVSPRHLEAVVTKTCQVLVEGAYSGVLEPERHYFPLSRDLSNLDDVLDRLADRTAMEETAERAYEEIFRSGQWSYGAFGALVRACLGAEPVAARRAGVPLPVTRGVARATHGLARLHATRFSKLRWFPGSRLTSPSATWIVGDPYHRRAALRFRASASAARTRVRARIGRSIPSRR